MTKPRIEHLGGAPVVVRTGSPFVAHRLLHPTVRCNDALSLSAQAWLLYRQPASGDPVRAGEATVIVVLERHGEVLESLQFVQRDEAQSLLYVGPCG